MSKEIYISSTPHETRLAIVENDALTEIYYERENEYTLAGSIYNGKVTRVLPGMQSSFVDIGLERDAFLYITDFMEEAGDSADFEASANAGDQPRGPRTIEASREGGSREGQGRERGRNGRDRGNDRDSQPRTPAEPTDADLFAEAVSSLDPARPVAEQPRAEGERGERGGRRGGRNRRDRNDRGPREPRPETVAAEPVAATPVIIPHPDAEEVGEGAPGADGSRRWRGRRGRRGNRGSREDASQTTQQVETIDTIETAAPAPERQTGPVDNAYGNTLESSQDIAPVAVNEEGTPWDDTRPRRERSERSGGRNRRDRGQQETPRVPRGFAPSASLYQVDGAAEPDAYADGVEQEMQAPAEPVILPGESLSKYRPGGSEPVSRQERPAAPPVTDFVVSGWDGGNVLPGETIRPRGPVADSGRETRARDDREGRGGRSRDDRGGRGGRDGRGPKSDRGPRPDSSYRGSQPRSEVRLQTPSPILPYVQATAGEEVFLPENSPEAQPLQSFSELTEHATLAGHQAEPAADATKDQLAAEVSEPTYLSDPETMPASHLITPLNSTFVAPPPVPEAVAAEAEFEPTEASASYRVDPVPPSEYRTPSPRAEANAPEQDVLETAAFGDSEVVQSEAAEPQAGLHAVQADEAVTPASSHVHHEPFEADPADLHTVSPDLRQAFEATPEAHAEAADSHEFTSISDSGEMHSEPVSDTLAAHALPSLETTEPSSPIQHETAVVSEHSEPAAGFAPGDGLLEEEEFLDDEDESAPLATLHAHNDAHDEPEHQETLEGAADLGSMLREMSIDELTRAQAVEEEDDEDFLEEDQDYEESASDSDPDAEEEEPAGFTGDADSQHGLAEHDEHENSEYSSGFEGERAAAPAEGEAAESRRDGRGSGRRDGRRGERDRNPERARRTGGNSDRERSSSFDRNNGGRRDHRGGRNSMQTTSLPAISELLKPGQEILCQIAKEPIAKKGARITSHIALPGRFLVFMPTVSHTGVSRKIESDGERRRLKEILLSEKGEAAGGFIVRTAAAGASEEELRSDLRFLLNLWTDIKTRSESSKSPALIYHDLNLVERVLRDQVTDTFSAIWVDTETEYERVLRFLQRFQPSLIRRVKLYTKETPLFEQFGITEEINKALRSKVWLKSGGSIVINQTEALVAIDINTGKFVGKTARLEDTIVKTNLDAIPEIVRQIRLRDLGGIIIIDFIDMDERKNRNKVMAALEEELKSDRAPSKVLPFNDFGLVAITRKRVKQSLERTLSTTCGICAGTGMVKSPVTVCNDIYIEMRKMHKHLDRGDVMLRVNPEVVKQLKSTTSRWLQEMEEMCGKTILIKSDPSLHPEQFDIH